MKDGQRPPTQEELQQKLIEDREKEFKQKMEEYDRKNKESEQKIEEFKHLLQHQSDATAGRLEQMQEQVNSSKKYDAVIVGVLVVLWLALIIHANFLSTDPPKGGMDGSNIKGTEDLFPTELDEL